MFVFVFLCELNFSLSHLYRINENLTFVNLGEYGQNKNTDMNLNNIYTKYNPFNLLFLGNVYF